jgi:hypothetical protein
MNAQATFWPREQEVKPLKRRNQHKLGDKQNEVARQSAYCPVHRIVTSEMSHLALQHYRDSILNQSTRESLWASDGTE